MTGSRTRVTQLMGLLCMVGLSGCATWSPPANEALPLFNASARKPAQAPELPSSRVEPMVDRNSVVRYQSQDSDSMYGPTPPSVNNVYSADGSDHLRYPMAPSQPVTPPSATIPPANAGLPATGNLAQAPQQYPAQQYPATNYPSSPAASYPGSPATNAPYGTAAPIGTNPGPGYASPAQAFGPPPGPTTPTQTPYGAPLNGVVQNGTVPNGTVPGTLPAPPGGTTVPPAGVAPGGTAIPPQWQGPPPSTIAPPFGAPGVAPPVAPTVPSLPYTDVIVNVQETQTGRLMFGAAVNSDAGVTGQIVLDEKNFDWRRWPRSFDDFVNGTAFRGAGQGFRVEAMPGNEVQRYLVSFTEPYFLDTRVSMQLSGFLYDRNFFDWNEQRLGGNIGFGYRVTPDLSVNATLRMQNVEISDPRVLGVPQLDAALGNHDIFGAKFSLTQDTRDIPFAPTQGYYVELAFEQVFGSFDYSRGTADFRRFFLLTERPDGSGRHVLSFANRVGITGSQTPIFENFFAGGVGTLRGFDFRGASPVSGGVRVGGELSFLGSVEYRFPITADDMIQGAFFCDYGTVEEEIRINRDNYRVALGFGLRVNVPAMGPAPIAIDFAVPVARADTDDIRQFSFFVGGGRF
ncbi:MAG: BamA/TamA family outer membrane protein [Planctomycetota bacterium]